MGPDAPEGYQRILPVGKTPRDGVKHVPVSRRDFPLDELALPPKRAFVAMQAAEEVKILPSRT